MQGYSTEKRIALKGLKFANFLNFHFRNLSPKRKSCKGPSISKKNGPQLATLDSFLLNVI